MDIHNLHICLIDDDEIQNFINEQVVLRFNRAIQVSKFLDAAKALDLLREGSLTPTIIFLDINMPLMTGWEFMDEFEKFTAGTMQVYILSSSKDPFDIEKSKTYTSVKGFLPKPLMRDNLEKILAQWPLST